MLHSQAPFLSLSACRIAIPAVVSLLLLGTATLSYSQSAAQLKTQRERLLRDIQLTDEALTQSRSREKQTLESLLLLDQQLVLRQEATLRFRQEADTLEAYIRYLSEAAQRAGEAAGEARLSYRQLARYRLYYRLQGVHPLVHMLAAPHWHQVLPRLLIYDRLAARRREAARRYSAEQQQFEKWRAEKEKAVAELQALLQQEEKQRVRLDLEKTERSNLLRQIQRNASALEAELRKQQSERQRLEESIAALIRKEVEAAEKAAREKARKEEEARKKTAEGKPASPAKPAKPAAAPLSASPAASPGSDFSKSRGKLPWPVDEALLVRPFGEQGHPDLPQVRINNTGIDLRTRAGAPVKAVFEGEVTGVQWVPGYAYTVILRHGSFYSVYSNMETIAVQKGQKLAIGAVVGTAARDPIKGTGEIHFEIWNGKHRQNPMLWLTAKK